jgi:hypothetical protein
MSIFFCRVAYNNLRWVRPSGVGTEQKSHYHCFRYAHEEWNNNPNFGIHNNLKYGWIEGFGRVGVPSGFHDIAMYSIHNRQRFFVGIILNCEQISGQGLYPLCNAAEDNRVMAADINRIGGNVDDLFFVNPIIVNPNMLGHPLQFVPNVRYRFEDIFIFPQTIPCNIRYDRYRALRVDGDIQRMENWENIRNLVA